MSWGDVNYEYPLYFALAYVFLFPIATAVFYAVTLWYKVLMNWIQQKIQDKTPLPQEKANKIIKENIRLELEHNKIVEELEKIKQDYSIRESALTIQYADKEKEFDKRVDEEVQKQTHKINSELHKTNTILVDKDNTIEALHEEINELKKTITQLKSITEEVPLIDTAYKRAKNSKNQLVNNLTIDQIKILAIFYNHDSVISINNLKYYANQDFKLSKTLVESRFKELSDIGLVAVDGGNCKITQSGKEILEILFN
ncbi:hypothetical protein [Sulfurimonas sp.]|uniref:hypothetical protein n=1 Tax=Sulfurimonas sp. TaxID=2022749 RepID=UPI0019E39B67|nr:hypothetical protein [Sulfurimonas sp.]MBE0515499.1 hypothetical protein [Sulfurimonas sp.]